MFLAVHFFMRTILAGCFACRAAALQTSLRDKTGVEKLVITRTAPVWTLEWNPSRDESPTLLAIGCWDQVRSQH